MADNTGKALRTKMIYSVFIRNYSKEGTFEALRQDLRSIARARSVLRMQSGITARSIRSSARWKIL